MNKQKKEFKIGSHIFSCKNPLVIAEIGTSHNGDFEKAKALIDTAFYAGASAVKFQIVYAEEILHPKTGMVDLPSGKIDLYEKFRELEVPISFYKELHSYTKSKGLLFSASPFGIKSADELLSLEPDFIKIASPELNYSKLLRHCAGFNLPMILSTGVSLLSDIEKALHEVRRINSNLQTALLHCITAYPAPESEYNISVIKNLTDIFNIPTGLSDHSMDPFLVPLLCLANGGFIIEKHICLSRKEGGLDDPVALEPEMFKKMCNSLKTAAKLTELEIVKYILNLGYPNQKIMEVIGSGEKKLSNSEKDNYGKTNRSLHYIRDLKKDSVITKDDIAVLRTEKELTQGELPDLFDFFIGAVLQKDITSGAGVKMEDFIKRH